MGSRHAGVVRRPGQDGAEHREDAGHGEGERHRQPAALEDAQVRRDCAVSDRDRVGRDLLRQGERGRSDVRARRREDSHDDQQSLGEQDPPRHEHQEVQQRLHPGGRPGAERAGSLGRGQGRTPR